MKKVVQKRLHPAERYVEDVLAGHIATGKLVKMACQRHVDDLKCGHRRGINFDKDLAQHAVKFFSLLHHSKGEWAGKVFKPSPWQQFITYSLFGWTKKNGTRRFNTAYIEVARKNGKTTFASGLGLYLFAADEEPGAEVYSAATKKDQAIITHSEATRMVRSSPDLSDFIGINRNNLHIIETASKFEPLGRDADSCDGLNIHGAIVDELHAHKSRDMWDVLETATGSRRQPLIIAITTAGFDRHAICWEIHEYVTKILTGVIRDDSVFGVIYTIDDEDRWDDESVWIKANPNLGISVKLDDLKRKAMKAKEMPSAQNNFLRKHLDVWTQQSERWIDLDLWDSNFTSTVEEQALKGKLCYGGLDLSSVSDLTAWVMVFPGDNDILNILARFWCPEVRLKDRKNRYRDQYAVWVKQGWLNVTPGDAIDYQFVKYKILQDCDFFNIHSLNVDRLFQGYQLAMELGEKLNKWNEEKVVGFGMGFISMAGPMKELESRLLKRQINHGNNPVMRFCADNLAVRQDPAGNLKPDKSESEGKIDGIVALVMALDRLLRAKPDTSIYVTKRLVVI